MGKDIIVAPYIFISFPLRFNSQPRKNMLGYSPILRLHLRWLIIFLQTMKVWSSRCLYVIVIISGNMIKTCKLNFKILLSRVSL
jgi:hypothetical protein